MCPPAIVSLKLILFKIPVFAFNEKRSLGFLFSMHYIFPMHFATLLKFSPRHLNKFEKSTKYSYGDNVWVFPFPNIFEFVFFFFRITDLCTQFKQSSKHSHKDKLILSLYI